MAKINNPGKDIKGERVGGPPENELDNFYICESCKQAVDRRDLGQVLHHETTKHEPVDLDA